MNRKRIFIFLIVLFTVILSLITINSIYARYSNFEIPTEQITQQNACTYKLEIHVEKDNSFPPVGHAWICIVKTCNGDVTRDCWGFYPQRPIGMSQIADAVLGEIRNDTGILNKSNINISIDINQSQSDSIATTASDWNKTHKWNATSGNDNGTSQNCVGFVKAVARNVNYNISCNIWHPNQLHKYFKGLNGSGNSLISSIDLCDSIESSSIQEEFQYGCVQPYPDGMRRDHRDITISP